MAVLDSDQFWKKVETQPDGLFFIFGEENYLVDQAQKYFREQAAAAGVLDFNFNAFEIGSVEISQILETAELLPFMSAHRYVLVKDLHRISEKDAVVLKKFIEKPVNPTVFVLTAGKIDRRKSIFKSLFESAVCVEFKKPYPQQVPNWIQYIVQGEGLEASTTAVYELQKRVGDELSEIAQEVRKLKDFISPRLRVEEDDVRNLIHRHRIQSVFEFVEALAKKNRSIALEQLIFLMEQGQSEVGIVSLIARQFRILLLLKKGQELALFGAKLAGYIQVPPFFLPSYIEQAQRWTRRRLEDALLLLGDTEKALKSSPISSHIWLENLILKLCQSEANLDLGMGKDMRRV